MKKSFVLGFRYINPVAMETPEETLYLVTDYENFIEPFKSSIAVSAPEDYNLLNTLQGGNMDAWENEKGRLAVQVREIVKRHVPGVTVGFFPWVVPHCAGGLFFILGGKREVLENVAKTFSISPVNIRDRKGAVDCMDSVTF